MRHNSIEPERLVLIAGGLMLFGVTMITYFRGVRDAAEAGHELSVLQHVFLFGVSAGVGILSIVALLLVMCAFGFVLMGLAWLAKGLRGFFTS